MASWKARFGKKKTSESFHLQPLATTMQKNMMMKKGTFSQKATMDGGDVTSWWNQWLIWLLLDDALKSLRLG